MNQLIAKNYQIYLKKLAICAIISFSSLAFAVRQLEDLPKAKLALDNGMLINSFVAITPLQQTKGLSGIKASKFKNNAAMLFYYNDEGVRGFWMPDTYFDLDIVFLSSDFKIIAIERNVQHHPGRAEPPKIAKTKSYVCRYVLEVKSKTDLAKALKVGSTIKWLEKARIDDWVTSVRK